MNEKMIKKMRKIGRKLVKNDIASLQSRPLFQRLGFAWRIVFKC